MADEEQSEVSQESDGAAQPAAKKTIGKLTLILGLSLLVLIVLIGSVAGGLFYYGKTQFEAPGPALAAGQTETIYRLERGQGVSQISQELESRGLIRNALIFQLGVRLLEADSDLKAGEYAIPASASMAEIMDILREGKSILYKLTVPEGLTSKQAMRLVAAHEILQGELSEADIPEEGAILPETYLFLRGTTRQEIIARMRQAHDEVLDELWANRAPDLPIDTPEDAVILASIVEKETGLAEERPLVAGVFVNRLKKGMRLESDPTIIYGLTEGEPLGRGLRQSELKKVTPYNTYEIDGLPPTPIANPGRESLAAVLNPPETKALFFVADGTGGHAFAETYSEHRRNVAAWRRIEREQKKKQ